MTSKRQGSGNFSIGDKELLIERIKRKRNVIENKKTDTLTVKAKEQAWMQITNEYNTLSSIPRSTAALRTCWKNMKKRYRKADRGKERNFVKTSLGDGNILLETDKEELSDSKEDQISYMASKRQRSENFSIEDKELLIETIKRKKDIVENKKADTLTLKAKEQAWMQIMNEYNTLSPISRSTAALKTCWKNMKKRYHKTYRGGKKKILKTGSGQHNDFQSDPLLYKLRDVLNSSLEGLQNPCDLNVLCNGGLGNGNISLEMDKEKLSDLEEDPEDTFLQTTANLSSMSKTSMVDVLRPVEERTAVCKSAKTSPYVPTLRSYGTTEAETQVLEDSKPVQFLSQSKENSPGLYTNNMCTSHRQSQQVNNFADALAESKLELAKLATEHAIAEEKRKIELHELKLQKTKLKIEILKLELENMSDQIKYTI